MHTKPILYLDLDDVLVDFNSSPRIPLDEKKIYNHPRMYEPGFFEELKPMPGARTFVSKLLDAGFWDVHILTQPVALSPISYTEKATWVREHFPELITKITMTQNKFLLRGDVLIDDSEKWKDFQGVFILFKPRDMSSWTEARDRLKLLEYSYLDIDV